MIFKVTIECEGVQMSTALNTALDVASWIVKALEKPKYVKIITIEPVVKL
jgi:hypothetical protein